MRAASFVFALFALAAFVGGPRHSAGAQTQGPSDVLALPSGPLALVDEERADAAVETAIEDAVGGLQPMMREAFRAQLRASMRLPRTLEIRDGGAQVRLDDLTLEATVGGPGRPQRGPEGRRVTVTHALADGGLMQTLEAPQFTRTSAFVPTESGVALSMSLRTRLLPRPITVDARYARR